MQDKNLVNIILGLKLEEVSAPSNLHNNQHYSVIARWSGAFESSSTCNGGALNLKVDTSSDSFSTS